jgi:hypothetical protein
MIRPAYKQEQPKTIDEWNSRIDTVDQISTFDRWRGGRVVNPWERDDD